MASVNRVIVLGNVGRDPETRYAASGSAICNVSIATTSRWKDAAGEKKEETEWHRVSAFGRLAEIIDQYVKKGDALFVEGRLRTRKWQDKDGVDRYTTEIVAENIQLMGGKKDSSDEPREQRQRPAPAAREKPPVNDDDDIPF